MSRCLLHNYVWYWHYDTCFVLGIHHVTDMPYQIVVQFREIPVAERRVWNFYTCLPSLSFTPWNINYC